MKVKALVPYEQAFRRLRSVKLQSELGIYTLRLYDTGATDTLGKAILAYEFISPVGNILFQSEDFHYPLYHGDVGNDRTLKIIIDWITAAPLKEPTIPQELFRKTVGNEIGLYAIEGVLFDEELPDDFDEVSTIPHIKLPELF